MAFEELTRRHATIWSSAPFENIAELISDMLSPSSNASLPSTESTGSTSRAVPGTSPSTRRRRVPS